MMFISKRKLIDLEYRIMRLEKEAKANQQILIPISVPIGEDPHADIFPKTKTTNTRTVLLLILDHLKLKLKYKEPKSVSESVSLVKKEGGK